MSLFVAGVPVMSVTFADIPRTSLSRAFASSLPPPRDYAQLFTMSAGLYGPFSFPLLCSLSSSTYDVVLGLDWAGHFRDSLIHAGLRPGSSFSAWHFFSLYIPPLQRLETHYFPPTIRPHNPPMPLVSRLRFSPSPAVRLHPGNTFLGPNLLLGLYLGYLLLLLTLKLKLKLKLKYILVPPLNL
ncbi:hypothetical protein DFH09DRAFT_1328046 [Mycena vulgaris]|nr:hypothetical protein DFH09DRAFT_1328046 [Mycena vulgaris]